ncbi:Plasmid maintenance system antidote protein [Paraburkholderia piptadeniae]|uniref:Plasmid maintenance system antidote protein n=1 Tax=Paraburkholderia piptadeniae TaxID=1701573 RepID=A0A1N7SV48_9BURK|nr:HigA family addiction module antitoxin [Paraburkholderia piptadeniae]SIT51346.1 Plasmid maintenance system antidote protein [Paraburkholderia piptadeniae]
MAKQPTNEFQPDYAVSPGEILGDELETRGMTQQELARRTGLTPKHIVSLVQAKSSITPETAIKLERALGMPADYWLNLESQYQEALARIDEEAKLEHDLDWLKRIPIALMTKLNWVERRSDAKAQLVEVLRFFGIASVSQWDDMWPNLNVAYRQHNSQEIFPEAVSAWLRRGEIEASQIPCGPFEKAAFRDALDKIRLLTIERPESFVPRMQELCAAAGVAVVFVPALPKTGVSGATRWLNANKAIIQLSLRYRTDDHLWFTFFHEAGHILLHGKKELFLEGANGLDASKEAEANHFAEQELLPRSQFSAFIRRNQFNKASIASFAKEIGIAPGIVVGQLQHRQLLPRNHCNELKQTFRWAHE